MECYGKLFCKQCEKCKTSVLPGQTGLAYDKKDFHLQCFCCTKCSKKFIEKPGDKLDPNKIYKEKKNDMYCEDCYGSLFCKPCTKCSKSVLPNQKGLLFDDKPFHTEW